MLTRTNSICVKSWQRLHSHFSTAVNFAVDFHRESPFIHTYPGSRVLELTSASTGNLISSQLATKICNKVIGMKENITVSAVIFQACSNGGTFSLGIDLEDYSNDKLAYIQSVHKLAQLVKEFEKPTICVYAGHSNATGFGVFAGSKYRLGTPSTTFRMDELTKGKLPIGGLPFYLAKTHRTGVEFARFLGVGDITLGSQELHSLGMITHVVEEDPHDSLAMALAHSVPGRETKYNQIEVVNIEAIEELLDTMHMGCDYDIMGDSLWDEVMLVRPPKVDLVEPTQSGAFEEIEEAVKYCFSVDDPSEALKRLRENKTKNEIIAQTAEHMSTLDPKIVGKWFKMTRMASTKKLEDVFMAELDVHV